jgi:hypothetical protein
MVKKIKVYIEVGRHRVFAGAVDGPGWCRIGKGQKAALQALLEYGPRCARGLKSMEN